MMSYLVRRENFADGTPPPKKPYSAVQFKNSTDTLLQGVYGTEKSSNAFLVDLMQKELDKAVTEGVVTMEEGLEFIKSRKKYYDDYLKEKSKTTDGPIGLPQIEERTELQGGTDPETGMGFQKGNPGFRTKDGEVRNVKGSNQFTPKTTAQIQAIINKPEYKGYTPTRFEKENILTRTDTKNKDVVFQKKGITPADPEKQKARDIKRGEAQTNLEGRKLKLKAPSGYQVHHIMPLAGGEELRTGDYAIVSKEMNAKMSKYNKKINKLVNEAYSLDFSKTENLNKLKNINNDLFDILETVKKDLPKKYKGLLGFNKLTPVLDTFDDKGRQVFYTEPQGIDYKKSIAGVQGDKVKDTKRSVIQNMVNKAKTFAFKPVEGLVENYKKIRPGIDKATQMFPGKADNAIAAAIDFPMMYMSGAPFSQAAASAGSMFMNNPNIGKMANVALEQAALSEEEQFLKNAMERRQGLESMLENIPARFRETIEENKGVKDETETYVP